MIPNISIIPKYEAMMTTVNMNWFKPLSEYIGAKKSLFTTIFILVVIFMLIRTKTVMLFSYNGIGKVFKLFEKSYNKIRTKQ